MEQESDSSRLSSFCEDSAHCPRNATFSSMSFYSLSARKLIWECFQRFILNWNEYSSMVFIHSATWIQGNETNTPKFPCFWFDLTLNKQKQAFLGLGGSPKMNLTHEKVVPSPLSVRFNNPAPKRPADQCTLAIFLSVSWLCESLNCDLMANYLRVDKFGCQWKHQIQS